MKGIAMKKILAFLIMLMPLSSFAQKLEDFKNSYNFKRGIEYLYGDTPDENNALECFQKEVSESPKNGYAHYYMGVIYDNNDQEGDALESLNKAAKLLKKDKDWMPYVYRTRARVYLKLGHDDLAENDWAAALKENPKDNSTLNDRAYYYYQKGKYELAETDYDAMISNEPGNNIGYVNKGLVRFVLKDYPKAEELYSYSLKLNPSDAKTLALRASLYLEEKKYNEASDDAISALSIDAREAYGILYKFDAASMDMLLTKLKIQQAKDKNNYLWSYAQGSVLENNDEYKRAISAYEQANGIYASDVFVYRIAQCYSELGDYNSALGYINRAILMDSTKTDYLLNRGSYLYELGKSSDAIASISSYIDKDPDNYFGYYRRAFFKDNTGDIDGAIEDYTTSLVLYPDNNYALVERGDCYKTKGNEEAAIADFKKAIEIDTVYNEDCCVQYAYLGLGQKEKAIEVQDSIFAHAQDKGTYYDAACLYSKMGEYDKAMQYLRTSLEKGFRRFTHIMNDHDLDGLKNREDFKALIKEFQAKDSISSSIDLTAIKKAMEDGVNSSVRISEIPFTRESGGLCKVKCNINGLPLNFWLDTGASNVSLSMVEATFMIKNGYLTKDDVVGSSFFLDANGNVSEGTVLNLRTVKFGDSELNNVKASVVSNLKAPLLLGQSILARLGSVEIDNAKQVIRIKYYN